MYYPFIKFGLIDIKIPSLHAFSNQELYVQERKTHKACGVSIRERLANVVVLSEHGKTRCV